MKTKLLALLLFLFVVNTAKSQTEISDYASGMADPFKILLSGTDMYVIGSQNIYRIDTTVNNPTPTVIYTISNNDLHPVNFTINNNIIYIVFENYIESTETFLGGVIKSLDLNNLSNPAQDVYATTEYISAITNDGSTLYITAETLTDFPNYEPFITHLDKINTAVPSPTAVLIANNVTNTSVVNSMIFDAGMVYILSSDDSKILKVDVNQSNPAINILTDYIHSKGVFKSGNDLYLANGSLISKVNVTNPAAGSTAVAINTTYSYNLPDGRGANWENFEDVVLIGNKVFATLSNQGKVVQAVDATLSADTFNLNYLDIYNDKSNIYVNGLKEVKEVTIFSVTGQLLVNKKMSSTINSIDISSLTNGIYLMNINNEKTIKFVK